MGITKLELAVFEKIGFKLTAFTEEKESKEYHAYRFVLNGKNIVYRKAKITPKKAGQFVCFWKRTKQGIIAPLSTEDSLDFYVITVEKGSRLGQFIFPKSILIKKGILSTKDKEGKRGFRVYPIWDEVNNKQAEKSQQWQLKYFFEIDNNINYIMVKELFSI